MKESTPDFEAVYDAFITEVVQLKKIWGLINATNEWCVSPSAEYEDTDVIPFWSQEQAALLHCQDEWTDFRPQAIDIDEFIIDWLPGMHEDDVLVGPQWNEQLEGLEIEPMDVAEEISLAQLEADLA